MPIPATCPSCQKTGSVPDSLVGRQIRCPDCDHRFEVEAPESPRPAPPRSASGAKRSLPLILAGLAVVGALAALLVAVKSFLGGPETDWVAPPAEVGAHVAPGPSPGPAGPAELPKDGWVTSRVVVVGPAGSPATVCLQSATEADTGIYRSLLAREIVRQALLIAARDGLGVGTRDGTIGDPDDPAGGRVVTEVASSLLPGRAVLTLRVGEARPSALIDEECPYKPVDHLWLLDRVEPLSRGRFVEALRDSGVAGTPKPPRAETPEDPAIEADLGTLSVFGQLAAVRAVHGEIRRGGESPQLLGELVRGYALLGVLTERLWNASHEAYMARSLLYARRLEALDPKSPRGPWHRAIAEALAGYPKAALDDLAEGDRRASATKPAGGPVPARPDWAPLIVAFCRDRADDLVVPGIDRRAPLAALLGFLAVENSSAVALIVETGRLALEANPECTRINDVVCDRGGVSINHWATELGPEALLEAIPARLRAIPGLPAAAEAAIGRSDEPALVRAMIAAAAPGEDAGEPSWAALGLVIRETRFVQVWRRLDFLRRMLRVSAVEELEAARPEVADHPYRNYLETFAFDQVRQREEIAGLLRPIDIRDPEDTAYSMILEILEEDSSRMNKLAARIQAHEDLTARDLARRSIEFERIHGYNQSEDLLRLSPDSPIARAAIIHWKWEVAEPHALDWERSDARHPDVLSELALKYAGLNRPNDAIRCLKAYLRLSPDQWAYEMLAGLYLAGGDKLAWKATFDEALTKPDTNLDHMAYRVRVAEQLMREGRWEEARPYAEDAAESWASRGMFCAIRCAEGRKDWDGAETWLRRLVERYPNHRWSAWLLWCARTGRGDVRQAEQAAVEVIRGLGDPPDDSDLPSIGSFLIWTGKTREALGAHRQYYDLTRDPIYGMSVVALADESKDPAARDAMLARLAEDPMPPAPAPADPAKAPKQAPPSRVPLSRTQEATIQLAGRLGAWLGGKAPALDLAAVDATLAPFAPSERGSLEYFLGRLLANHDRPDDAARYLGRAAKGRETHPWFRVLAIRELRRKGVALSDDDIAPPDDP